MLVFKRGLVQLTSGTGEHLQPGMSRSQSCVVNPVQGGQVRVAWFAFVSNNPEPGATSGPCVVKLVSEDLRSADRDARTFSRFFYTAARAHSTDMEKIISGMVPQILQGIDSDRWNGFEKA